MPDISALLGLASAAGDKVSAPRKKLMALGYQELQDWRARKYSEKQYDKQFQDNIRFWEMQNTYNSPQEQMKRFQAAGLNKNLIYGNGTPGLAGSIQTPDVVKGKFDKAEFQPDAPLLPAIESYADLQLKGAQTDNLKAQRDVILEEAILKRNQAKNVMTEAERKSFDLDLAREIRGYSVEGARENVRKNKIGTDIAIEENKRRDALTNQSLQEGADRLLQNPLTRDETRQRIANMKQDGTLKKLEIDLRNEGVTFNDPLWQRFLAMYGEKIFNSAAPKAAEIAKDFKAWRAKQPPQRAFNPKL